MNRAHDTKPEVTLRLVLWRMGLRYRKNVATLPGKPDIVFVREKVAIFCDGDFWHGRNWRRLRKKLQVGTNSDYWVAKIMANRERDRRHAAALKRAGWMVIRIWETDVARDVEAVAAEIWDVIARRRA